MVSLKGDKRLMAHEEDTEAHGPEDGHGAMLSWAVGLFGLFLGTNYFFNHTQIRASIGWAYTPVLYLLAGGVLPILAIFTFLKKRRITEARLGLTREAWSWKTSMGIPITATFAGYFGMTGANPSLADVCLWYVVLLVASLAEVLVFIEVIYTSIESTLISKLKKERLSGLIAIVVTSVAFGIFHVGYPTPFNQVKFVLGLMVIMGMSSSMFFVSRNFYGVFLLHNVFATIGFVQGQAAGSLDLSEWVSKIPVSLTCFALMLLGLMVVVFLGKNRKFRK